ncbi:hypothetical protein JK363_39170 [Streptomyces sp. 205]|uniref:Uncharacterized protein n=1 Tax=Streptomyces coffeae TaxID=621382 RepID=A0ABS1NR24_9ACTN|nr:hypothetical protein [Streptomyces coffeae]
MHSISRRNAIAAVGTATVVVASLFAGSSSTAAAATADPAASASVAQKTPAAKAIAGKVQQYIARAWPRLNRDWPGVDYTRQVAILSWNKGRENYLVDTSGMRAVAKAELAKEKIEVPPVG